MTLKTFDFFVSNWELVYPEEGMSVQYGGSYIFSSAPTSPSQRTFKLAMVGIQYFLNGSGNIYAGNALTDAPLDYARNAKRLEDFYVEHKQWKEFIYPHPVYGNLTCKFGKPLALPKLVGNGVIGAFDLELREQP